MKKKKYFFLGGKNFAAVAIYDGFVILRLGSQLQTNNSIIILIQCLILRDYIKCNVSKQIIASSEILGNY